jgi:hypothetical protein
VLEVSPQGVQRVTPSPGLWDSASPDRTRYGNNCSIARPDPASPNLSKR